MHKDDELIAQLRSRVDRPIILVTAVFAPGPEPKQIEEIAAKLRKAAGLPNKPTGKVAND